MRLVSSRPIEIEKMMRSRNNDRSFLVTVFSLMLMIYNFRVSWGSVVSTGDFSKDFTVSWGADHVSTSGDGRTRTMKLDRQSGAGFASNNKFLFGQIDMKIKLIPGHSAGTVVAFYLSSDQLNRDEIDFEFLGSGTGQPYILQTNVYTNGFDGREERINLWFDPTADFHTYSILWNKYQIVFMVDWVPVRTYRNHSDKGAVYPSNQAMGIKASIWDGSTWATRGGKEKVDWSKAPFVASFTDYKIDACVWNGNNAGLCGTTTNSNWWNNENMSSLNWRQRRLFKWVRKYHLIYDYCQDHTRFNNTMPKECSLPKY